MNAAPDPTELFELSVVIPTCGRAELLARSLEALLAQCGRPAAFEIIVVLDGEDAASAAAVHAISSSAGCPIRLVEQARQGASAARNAGIDRARGRVVLLLDDDILAGPGLIARHLAHHRRTDHTVVIGATPVQPVPDEPAHHRRFREWWERELAARAEAARPATFRDLTSGNVSIPRRWLLACGGFDPSFCGYGREDYELGQRLLEAGLRFVYEPQAVGLHCWRKPPDTWLREWESIGQADLRFLRRHPQVAVELLRVAAFPDVRIPAPTLRLLEGIVRGLNRRGGRVWRLSASLAMAAYYWRGVRGEARHRDEVTNHRRLMRLARRAPAGTRDGVHSGIAP